MSFDGKKGDITEIWDEEGKTSCSGISFQDVNDAPSFGLYGVFIVSKSHCWRGITACGVEVEFDEERLIACHVMCTAAIWDGCCDGRRWWEKDAFGVICSRRCWIGFIV